MLRRACHYFFGGKCNDGKDGIIIMVLLRATVSGSSNCCAHCRIEKESFFPFPKEEVYVSGYYTIDATMQTKAAHASL